MTIAKLSFLLIILATNFHSFGQPTIKGRILDSATREPIPYANIGLPKSNIGTLSNLDGSFSLYIPEHLHSDTLMISSVGFGSKAIPLNQLPGRNDITIYLAEQILVLYPVTIKAKKELETFELGNTEYKGGFLQTDTLYAGRSVALLIDNQSSNSKKEFRFPAFIEKARLRIFRNNLGSFRFRIRLNEVNNLTGQPGEDILTRSIIMESSVRNGWLEFDLSSQNIEIDRPFFVVFEQLLDLNDRTRIAHEYKKFELEHPKKIKIDTVMVNGKKEVRRKFLGNGIDLAGTFIGIATSQTVAEKFSCYIREASFGEWTKVRGIVAATVTLSTF